MATQDVPHSDLVDHMAHVRQGTLNTAITPRRILFGHVYHELLDLLRHGWPAQLYAARAPVKLLRDQSLVPAQEGVRRGERRNLFETLTAKRMGQCREAAAFGVGQAQPAAVEVGFEDAVFLLQIGNDLLLVPLDPPGDHGDQDMENHNSSSGWRP